MPFDPHASVDKKLMRRETPFVTEAYARAVDMLRRYSIDPKRYPDFNSDMVAKDMAEADYLERRFEQQDSPATKEEAKIAKIFEVALWWLTQQKKFLGEKTKASLPSRYDDYRNGTDLILEMLLENQETARLGLGIDATFGATSVEKKLSELQEKVEKGALSEIRYFVSSDKKERRSLSGVPHVIVGLSVERARELGQLWMRSEKGEAVSLAPDRHPLRALILQQLVAQTNALSILCYSRGNHELSKRYEEAFKRLQPIYMAALAAVDSKQWKDILEQDYRHDPVHRAVIARTEAWKKLAAEGK